jgi:tetratricopeptide (TPR) repeat protein
MVQENMAFDRAVNKKIRALAQALEQDNQPDLASALYYNLAFMSAVESIVMPDGQEKLIGYSFDYVPSNPQRKADYDKAFALNLSTPHLSHFKFRTKAEPQADADADRLARLRARVSDGEREFALDGERLWPSDYWLTYSYTNLGMFDKACEWLKRIREFEPTALRDTGGRIGSWDMELQLLNDAATRANFAGEQCKY